MEEQATTMDARSLAQKKQAMIARDLLEELLLVSLSAEMALNLPQSSVMMVTALKACIQMDA